MYSDHNISGPRAFPILLCWDIGQGIIEKQKTLGWGKSVVQNLAKDLQLEFPGMRGFSTDNLWRMRQFYSEYSTDKFLSHAETEVRRLEVVEFLEQAVPEVRGKTRGGDLDQAVPDLAMTVRQLLAMVPWGHHVEIMKKVSEPGHGVTCTSVFSLRTSRKTYKE